MMNAEEVSLEPDNTTSGSNSPKATDSSGLDSFSSKMAAQKMSEAGEDRTERFEILVSDPVKMGEGMSAFISYKVVCRILNSTGSTVKRTTSVIRRFSDFAWLLAHLRKAYPGYIIPPLPEKVLVGKFDPVFVEKRRAGLEKFLNRIGEHHALHKTTVFKDFLSAEDAKLAGMKNASKVSGTTSAGLLSWISSAAKNLTSVKNMAKTPEDVEFAELEAYIDGLSTQLRNVNKHVGDLVQKNRNLATGLFEFGLSFQLLGQSEADNLGEALAEMGSTADKLSVLASNEADAEDKQLKDPIQDYCRIVASVKTTLVQRSEAKRAWLTAKAELQSRESAHGTALAKYGDDHVKTNKTKAEVVGATQKVRDLEKELEQVSKRVLDEVARFKAAKLSDFRKIVLDFVNLQIQYNKKVEDAWQTLLPKLEALDDEDSI